MQADQRAMKAEEFEAMKQRGIEQRAKRKERGTNEVLELREVGYMVVTLSEYHLRVTRPGSPVVLDVYPTNRKFHLLTGTDGLRANQRGNINKAIRKLIFEIFEGEMQFKKVRLRPRYKPREKSTEGQTKKEFFAEIWQEREGNHFCVDGGKFLGTEGYHFMFSHDIDVSLDKSKEWDKTNISLRCQRHHFLKDHGTVEQYQESLQDKKCSCQPHFTMQYEYTK